MHPNSSIFLPIISHDDNGARNGQKKSYKTSHCLYSHINLTGTGIEEHYQKMWRVRKEQFIFPPYEEEFINRT